LVRWFLFGLCGLYFNGLIVLAVFIVLCLLVGLGFFILFVWLDNFGFVLVWTCYTFFLFGFLDLLVGQFVSLLFWCCF
jgi:hypothetical protein